MVGLKYYEPDKNTHDSPKNPQQWKWIGGILFTFAFAFAGMALAKLPVLERLGPMVIAILLAMIFRQFVGYPEALRSGVQFSAKKILRYAIILFGFKLNLGIILNQGPLFLLRDAGSIVIAIGLTMLVARMIKADLSLSMLLGVGTGVCGAAAIAAVSPLIKAKEEDTAIGVAIIALVGTIFTIAYTLLYPFLGQSPVQYGTWSGLSLHEIAHVAAAAAPAGENALAVALLAKLGRVLLLVPLCFLIIIWMNHRNKSSEQVRIEFPWFLVGFILTAIIGSFLNIPKDYMQSLANISSFLLTSAMVGLGLNIHFKAILTRSVRPLISMLVASVVLSFFTFFTLM